MKVPVSAARQPCHSPLRLKPAGVSQSNVNGSESKRARPPRGGPNRIPARVSAVTAPLKPTRLAVAAPITASARSGELSPLARINSFGSSWILAFESYCNRRPESCFK